MSLLQFMMGCVGKDPDAQGSGSEKRFIKRSRQKSESGTGKGRDNKGGNTGGQVPRAQARVGNREIFANGRLRMEMFRDQKDMMISIPRAILHTSNHEWDESNSKLGVRNVRRICVSGL